MSSTSANCKCLYNFTCGYCLSNRKPALWTPTNVVQRRNSCGIVVKQWTLTDEQMEAWKTNGWNHAYANGMY